MMKRIFSIILAIALAVSIIPMSGIAEETVQVDDTNVTGLCQPIVIDESSLNKNVILGTTENLRDESGKVVVSLDGSGGFYSQSRGVSLGINEGGIPDNGYVCVAGVPYRLACGNVSGKAYDGNDSIALYNGEATTAILHTTGCYDRLYFLSMSGGVSAGEYAVVDVTLTYEDDTITRQSFNIYDWFDEEVEGADAISDFLRHDPGLGDDNIDGSTTGAPNMWSTYVDADGSKRIKSVTFEMTGASADNVKGAVFAITGMISADAPQIPSVISASNITETGFDANWQKVSNATGYRLDVSRNAEFTSIVSGYDNLPVGDVSTYSISCDMSKGQTYYYRVRSENATGQSLSSTTRIVKSNGHTHNEVNFDAILDVNTGNSIPEGNYYLESDLVVNECLTIENGTVNLCMNGHRIIHNNSNQAGITVGLGATLNLYDCNQEQKHNWYVSEDGIWTLKGTEEEVPYLVTKGGYITGVNSGIYLNGGSLNLYDVDIIGNVGKGVEICNNGGLTVNGNTSIIGNGCYRNDKYVNQNLYISNTSEVPQNKITVAEDFEGSIGVTLSNITGEFTGKNTTDLSKYFKSDNTDCKIKYNTNGVLELMGNPANVYFKSSQDVLIGTLQTTVGEQIDITDYSLKGYLITGYYLQGSHEEFETGENFLVEEAETTIIVKMELVIDEQPTNKNGYRVITQAEDVSYQWYRFVLIDYMNLNYITTLISIGRIDDSDNTILRSEYLDEDGDYDIYLDGLPDGNYIIDFIEATDEINIGSDCEIIDNDDGTMTVIVTNGELYLYSISPFAIRIINTMPSCKILEDQTGSSLTTGENGELYRCEVAGKYGISATSNMLVYGCEHEGEQTDVVIKAKNDTTLLTQNVTIGEAFTPNLPEIAGYSVGECQAFSKNGVVKYDNQYFAYQKNATLYAEVSPIICTQPTEENGYRVVTEGRGISYQWYYWNEYNYEYEVLDGETGSILISPQLGNEYFCRVTGMYGSYVDSDNVECTNEMLGETAQVTFVLCNDVEIATDNTEIGKWITVPEIKGYVINGYKLSDSDEEYDADEKIYVSQKELKVYLRMDMVIDEQPTANNGYKVITQAEDVKYQWYRYVSAEYINPNDISSLIPTGRINDSDNTVFRSEFIDEKEEYCICIDGLSNGNYIIEIIEATDEIYADCDCEIIDSDDGTITITLSNEILRLYSYVPFAIRIINTSWKNVEDQTDSSLTTGENGGIYHCVVTGKYGVSKTSNMLIYGCEHAGKQTDVVIKAQNDTTLFTQNVTIGEVFTPNLPEIAGYSVGEYLAFAKNGIINYGNQYIAYQENATLYAEVSPVICTQPTEENGYKVVTNGEGITYQWYCRDIYMEDEFAIVEGETGSILISPQYRNEYFCRVTGMYGSYVDSDIVECTIEFAQVKFVQENDVEITTVNAKVGDMITVPEIKGYVINGYKFSDSDEEYDADEKIYVSQEELKIYVLMDMVIDEQPTVNNGYRVHTQAENASYQWYRFAPAKYVNLNDISDLISLGIVDDGDNTILRSEYYVHYGDYYEYDICIDGLPDDDYIIEIVEATDEIYAESDCEKIDSDDGTITVTVINGELYLYSYDPFAIRIFAISGWDIVENQTDSRLTTGENGEIYHCVVTGKYGASKTSNMLIYGCEHAGEQTKVNIKALNGTALFSQSAVIGEPLTINRLKITGYSVGEYQVFAKNGIIKYGNKNIAYQENALIIVEVSPIICTQPSQTNGYRVVTEGRGITYQWYSRLEKSDDEFETVAGETGSILKQPKTDKEYYCRVTGMYGSYVDSIIVSGHNEMLDEPAEVTYVLSNGVELDTVSAKVGGWISVPEIDGYVINGYKLSDSDRVYDTDDKIYVSNSELDVYVLMNIQIDEQPCLDNDFSLLTRANEAEYQWYRIGEFCESIDSQNLGDAYLIDGEFDSANRKKINSTECEDEDEIYYKIYISNLPIMTYRMEFFGINNQEVEYDFYEEINSNTDGSVNIIPDQDGDICIWAYTPFSICLFNETIVENQTGKSLTNGTPGDEYFCRITDKYGLTIDSDSFAYGNPISQPLSDAKYDVYFEPGGNTDIRLKVTDIKDGFDISKLKVVVNNEEICSDERDYADGTLDFVIASVDPYSVNKDISIKIEYDSVTIKNLKYSLNEYYHRILDTSDESSKLFKLCEAALNYGAWADVYFNNRGNSRIADIEKLDLGKVTIPDPDEGTVMYGSRVTEDYYSPGVSVALNSDVSLAYEFSSTQELKESDIVVKDSKGIVVNSDRLTIAGKNNYDKNGNFIDISYKVCIHNIDASELSESFNLSIKGSDFHITYSVYEYCYKAQSFTCYGNIADLRALCKALYLYGEAAGAYSASLK